MGFPSDRPALTLQRISDARFAPFDGRGAMLFGGRWNPPGVTVLYAADSPATAMLETLARLSSLPLPGDLRMHEIEVADGVLVERLDIDVHPDWMEPGFGIEYGSRWVAEGRSAILLVPSVIVPAPHFNAVIHLAHPDVARLKFRENVMSLRWDPRLFR